MAQKFEFTVNGKPVSVALDNEETPLLNVLRNELGLMGTRFGCGLEQCGCCMVLIDGEPEKCCAKPVWSVAGKADHHGRGPGHAANARTRCNRPSSMSRPANAATASSGILISAKALLDSNPTPTRAEIAQALDGNICRCGSHNRIMRAVEKAAAQSCARDAAR